MDLTKVQVPILCDETDIMTVTEADGQQVVMFLFYLTILALLTESVFANAITPQSTEKLALEGGKTTLSCNYDGSDIRSLQWYRQYPNTAPEFLLQAFENLGPEEKDRYAAEALKDTKQLNLEISKTEIADSAIYYCALVPTVTGNPSTLYRNLRNSSANTIYPLSSEKHVFRGQNVILSCNYSVNVNNLQWYRQYPGSRPEHLILITENSPTDPSLRLSAKATKEIKRVDLMISSAEVSDSAVYYCALKPTVTGNTRTLYKNL
ncbi:hypothetical protein PO909_031065 [Leuciscus waleckii]